MSNATYLFQKPNRNYHNSESFWTVFFALYLIEISKSNHHLNIPAYQHRKRNNRRCFDPDGDLVVPNDLFFKNIVIEGRITKDFVKKLKEPIPKDLSNLKPDIIIQTKDEIIIVEVKTIGSEITNHQKECYLQIKQLLKDNGYNVSLYFLISAGYEGNLDILDSGASELQEFKILLWEQIFKHLFKYNSNSLLAKYLGDIEKYYTPEEEFMS